MIITVDWPADLTRERLENMTTWHLHGGVPLLIKEALADLAAIAPKAERKVKVTIWRSRLTKMRRVLGPDEVMAQYEMNEWELVGETEVEE